MNRVEQPRLMKIAVFFLSLLPLLCATTTQAEINVTQGEGTYDGFFYSFWKENGDANMTIGENGHYQAVWTNNTEEWIGGVGWKPGGARIVNYTGSYLPDNETNSSLSLHGWTEAPYIEYSIVETYGSWKPSDGSTYYGSYQSDGAEYDLYYKKMPLLGIDPKQTYQYISIRKEKKTHGPISGTITTGNHFTAWSDLGLDLGNHNYMIMATWSYQGGGSTDITVSSTDTAPDPSTETKAGSIHFGFFIALSIYGFASFTRYLLRVRRRNNR